MPDDIIVDPDKTEETTDTDDQVSPLDLSDEDFFALGTPEEGADLNTDTKTVVADPEKQDDDDKESEEETDSKEEEEETEEKVFVDPETEPEKEKIKEDVDVVSSADKEPEKEDNAAKVVDPVESGIDYKAEYEKLLSPFKANGTEMAVKSTDDAVRLMQMGANYHKKMAGLKPVLKNIKLLEKNGLMDEDKLNFLIDINNQDPKAITKLLKDSQMDPMDINVKDESTYVPTPRQVSDSELELDQVLDEIKDSDAYPKTLQVVTKEWDQASKSIVAQHPHFIGVIHEQVENGIYDKVMGAVNYERSLGNLRGISDFEAYKQMGDTLHAAGQLGNPALKKETEPEVKSEADPKKDEQRKINKKAAQPNKKVPGAAPTTFNPLDLSDEEFEKMDPMKFIKQKT